LKLKVRIIDAADRDAIRELLSPARVRDAETDRRVADIVNDVREKGDEALLRYARTYDGLDGDIEISRKEMTAAARAVPAPVRAAIRTAAHCAVWRIAGYAFSSPCSKRVRGTIPLASPHPKF